MTELATDDGWRLAVNRTAALPPMAWLLRASSDGSDTPEPTVTCGELVASNSLVGLLMAADLELDREVDYPARFGKSGEDVMRFSVPTTSLAIEVVGFDGIR